MDKRFLASQLDAEGSGIRLEIIGGLPVWEAAPVVRHQRAIDRIRASIRSTSKFTGQPAPGEEGGGCGCIHLSDVFVSFPDGSLKRPDIAIFCREPDEQDEAITLIPEAVVEVISKGYEAKDLELAPHFYLAQGVKDVLIFDPYTLLVLHIRRDGVQRLVSPVAVQLECGCECVV